MYSGQRDQGNHTIMWNSKDNYGKPVSAGLYFYSIRSDNHILSGKMLLVKWVFNLTTITIQKI